MFYCEACGKPRHHHDHGYYALAGTEFDGICEDCAQNSKDVYRCKHGHYWLVDTGLECPTCGWPDDNYDGPSDAQNPLLNFDAMGFEERAYLQQRNESRWLK